MCQQQATAVTRHVSKLAASMQTADRGCSDSVGYVRCVTLTGLQLLQPGDEIQVQRGQNCRDSRCLTEVGTFFWRGSRARRRRCLMAKHRFTRRCVLPRKISLTGEQAHSQPFSHCRDLRPLDMRSQPLLWLLQGGLHAHLHAGGEHGYSALCEIRVFLRRWNYRCW